MKVEEIKELRRVLSLSQEKFAHMIGVTAGTYCRWEKGLCKPSPLALNNINKIMTKRKPYERN